MFNVLSSSNGQLPKIFLSGLDDFEKYAVHLLQHDKLFFENLMESASLLNTMEFFGLLKSIHDKG